jgi:hypothetical protein
MNALILRLSASFWVVKACTSLLSWVSEINWTTRRYNCRGQHMIQVISVILPVRFATAEATMLIVSPQVLAPNFPFDFFCGIRSGLLSMALPRDYSHS